MDKKKKMRELSRVRNKKIKFVYKTEGKDEDGFPIEEWKTFKEVWASVRGLRGREFYQAAAVQAQDDKVFNCKYFPGLTPDMYIEYQGRKFNIKSINNVNEQNIEYEIHASEVSPSE